MAGKKSPLVKSHCSNGLELKELGLLTEAPEQGPTGNEFQLSEVGPLFC